MRVSVIIPTLNEERLIVDTLARTTRSDVSEIIVVDGGSSDCTQALVKETARRLGSTHPIHLLTSPAGRARQMNVGAAASHGEILLFLHADTRLPEGAIAAVTRACGDQGCIGGRFDVQFDTRRGLAPVIAALMNWRSRWTGISTGDQALFVRRDVFARLDGFPDVPLMEDVELTRRLKQHGRLAALRLRVVTSSRRWQQCGPIRTIVLMWALRALYWCGASPERLARLYAEVR
ncbi:TIGR04283 family arsenosugar biosynthesis glycosyltransferase [Candidatus Nitrospira bockiana]